MSAVATERRTLGARLARAVHRHVLLIAAIVVAVTGAVALYSFFAPDRYEARAELLVSPVGDDPLYAGLDVLRDTEERTAAETVAELVVAPSVLDAIRVRLDVPDRDSLRDAVGVDAVGDSNVVAITAEAEEATRAAQIANAFADETLSQQSGRFQAAVAALTDRTRRNLDAIPADERDGAEARALARRLRQLDSLRGLPDPALQNVGDAVAPREPVWPKPELILPAALLGSLLFALAFALALDLELVSRQAPVPAGLAEREAAVAAREQAVRDREAAVASAPPRAPPPQGAVRTKPLQRPRTLADLQALVQERAADFALDQVVEWEAYIDAMRPHTAPDGRLPTAFEPLIDDVFAELGGTSGDGRGEE